MRRESKLYFGTDGIRDLASFFDDGFLNKTAKAIVGIEGVKRIVIGRDTRESGGFISAVLGKRLADLGIKVIDIGIAATPLVAFYVKYVGADLGIVVSASHNPPEYNGIKIFNRHGEKPDGKEEAELEFLMDHPKTVESEPSEVVKDDNAPKAYAEYLKKCIPPLAGLKVALDCANGAMGVLAPLVFKELGADVTAYKCGVSGADINDGCGATSIGYLKEIMKSGGYDIGFAFDGDGDRVITVVRDVVYDGDWEMCVLAVSGTLKADEIVGTVMTNTACENYLAENGVTFIRTPVGDKYVWEEMKRRGAVIGGEKAGHVILSDYASTGDGLVVAASLAAAYKNAGGKWITPRDFPEVSLTVAATKEQKEAFEKSGVVSALKADAKARGMRLVVRPSGTEPKIRITAEAKTKELAESFARLAETKIKGEING